MSRTSWAFTIRSILKGIESVYLTRFQPFLEFLRDYKGKKIIGLTQDSWGLYIALDLGWTKLMVHVPPEAILFQFLLGCFITNYSR